ncbi:MAG: HAD family hydrolase [Pirellulales bacterium]|nr:HAD family hydrolase [Pirellulales bacterium]
MLDLTPRHSLFVGIDSDGCAFDTMEVKHKECFIPNTINSYNLQGVSKYAREVAEFVNLYSKSRGINRFPALIETLERLGRRPEVRARGVQVRVPPGLAAWVRRETKLANPALQREVEATGDPDLAQALAWSVAVNEAVARIVRGVPPFPFVRESLMRLAECADLVVVSATPSEALRREWEEHNLAGYVRLICGQEVGTKKECLAAARQYGPGKALMIGDAPGDQQAAAAAGCLFFPIIPGAEEQSWQRFFEEGIERFLAGTFTEAYQRELAAEFDRALPDTPPWER